MRQRAKTDRNHAQIVRELRQAGCSVCDLSRVGHGCPDILVGLKGKNYVFEIKAKRPWKLTDDQVEWHFLWGGQVHVIETTEQALKLMSAYERLLEGKMR